MPLLIVPLVEWTLFSTSGFCMLIINGLILNKEYKKRKSNQAVFISKISRKSSLICMIFGLLYALMLTVSISFPFCFYGPELIGWFSFSQFTFMGFYQLWRLHYSFSQSQVHSNKGYPNWLFILMSLIGVFFIINPIIAPFVFNEKVINCGINGKYQFFRKTGSAIHPFLLAWWSITGFIYVLWDITTFILYVIKIRSFRKYKTDQIDVYNRIVSILHRIFILTALYEIIFFFSTSCIALLGTVGYDGIMVQLLPGLQSVAMNYSMFLMQRHNDLEYKSFLRLLYGIKLHYICCCCCQSIIRDEIKAHSESSKVSEQIAKKDEKTVDDTQDMSVKNEHSNIQELSAETMTQNKIVQ